MKKSQKIILGALLGALFITIYYFIFYNKTESVKTRDLPVQLYKPTQLEKNKATIVPSLPLGEKDLEETRQTTEIAPGLTYTKIIRGKNSGKDTYIVDVAYRITKQQAQNIASDLISKGYQARIESTLKTSLDGSTYTPFGYLVRVGNFPLESPAIQLRNRLVTEGYLESHVVASSDDKKETTGPWVINVLTINPKDFKGKIVSELGTGIIPGREKLTSMAARTHALAAVNGGYFRNEPPKSGIAGDPAGISVVRGELTSEAVDNRTSFIFSSTNIKAAKIASITTHITVTTATGIKQNIDGVNRKPNSIKECSKTNNTNLPKSSSKCLDIGEMILFTPKFGTTTDSGQGIEAVIDSNGKVIEVRNKRGGSIPSNGSVLAGTGKASDWIRSHISLNSKVKIDTRIMADGRILPVDKTTSIVNGVPRLLKDGRIFINAVAEGSYQPDHPQSYYQYGERRNPRTLAGIKPDGTILLVTVDGRRPGYSVGVNLLESARLMQALGASEAVNLDGGGSTSMTIGDRLINLPSDISGERPIGDGILILP